MFPPRIPPTHYQQAGGVPPPFHLRQEAIPPTHNQHAEGVPPPSRHRHRQETILLTHNQYAEGVPPPFHHRQAAIPPTHNQHADEVPPPSHHQAGTANSSNMVFLTPEMTGISLHEMIRGPVEYWFGPENLSRDEFLKSKMDGEGWVPISRIITFPSVSVVAKCIRPFN